MKNPFVWMARWRHRCGYGVHSPFAYNLITQVLYSPGRYYADEWLDLQFPWWVRAFSLLPIRRARLLFRLSNHFQPRTICALGATKADLGYLHQGCLAARLVTEPQACDLLYLGESASCPSSLPASLLVLDGLPRRKTLFRELKASPRVTVTFDLHSLALLVCDPHLQKQDYIINW